MKDCWSSRKTDLNYHRHSGKYISVAPVTDRYDQRIGRSWIRRSDGDKKAAGHHGLRLNLVESGGLEPSTFRV